MHRDGPLTKMVPCPKCGLFQSVTFVNNSVGVEQRCIGCGEYAWFELPAAGAVIVDNLKRLFK